MSPADTSRRRLDVWDAFSDGLSLAASRNGLVLMLAFFAVQTVSLLLFVAGGSVYLPLDQAADVVGEPSGLPVGSDLSVAGTIGAMVLASGFSILVSTPLSIVAIRTFVVGATEHIPEDCLFHRLGRATLSGILATLLVGALFIALLFGGVAGLVLLVVSISIPFGLGVIAVGFLLLLVGFVVLWIHVLFLTHEIAVRDRGVFGAVRGSWATVRGNRWRVFALALLVAAINGGAGWAGSPGFENALGPLSLAALVLTAALSAIFGVATTAVLARAYRQLSPDDAVRSDSIGD